MSQSPAEYRDRDVKAQKEHMRELFSDAGWESLRVLEGMDAADDFYMQESAQVKMPQWQWSQGRVTLVGDAGYCPSPISGMGTTLAIVGAYILAGEIGACKGDFQMGLEGYGKKMKPFVLEAQALPPGAPGIANPQTQWGISILYGIVGFVSWSRIPAVFSRVSKILPKGKSLQLPDYEH